MAEINVRRLELSDLQDVLAILVQSWDTPDVVGPAILNRMRANPDYQYVAERGGDVVGFQTSYGIDPKAGVGSVGYFATDIEHRRTRVASELVGRFLKDMEAIGVHTVRTQTGARPFFESLGFHVAETWRRMAKGLAEYHASSPEVSHRQARVRDVGLIESTFGRDQAEAYLLAQFAIFRDEPHRALIDTDGSRARAVVVGRTDPRRHDTVSVAFLAGVDDDARADICDALARQTVVFATSDLVIQVKEDGLGRALDARGWRELGQQWVMEKAVGAESE
jgi:N-acetylglutamate synthase-like GNAT family acetyltransferase